MNKEKLEDIHNQLRDWFWNYGSKRKGAWSISRDWLDKVDHNCGLLNNIYRSKKKYEKPAIALWGPSQSGKSTLLAKFIDYGKGALSWKDEFHFSGKTIQESNVLNPYNSKRDASGCVTRFVMRDNVDFPETPVEIEFATEREILMSLAFGYLTEMQVPTDSAWTDKKLTDFLKVFKSDEIREAPKELFLRLEIVLKIVEAFFLCEQPRYEGLRLNWETMIRPKILNCNALIASKENFQKFVSKLFWDETPILTETWERLLKKRQELEKKIRGKKIYCSYKVAKLFLDIDSGKKANEGKRNVRNNILNIHEEPHGEESLGFRLKSDKSQCFNNTEDFADTQALISTLIVPLKKDVIKLASLPLFNLLEEADIVDFPGVANKESGLNETRETQETLEKDKLKVLTRVMKRGKTSSIVISYAQNLDISVFSLLLKMNTEPRKAEQQMAGIKAWYESMLGEKFSKENARKLQINFLQTYSAILIRDVTEFKHVFETLEDMGDLCDPQNVDFFAINYPEQDEGRVDKKGDELNKAISNFEEDPEFQKYYPRTHESLRKSLTDENGGRTFLFEKMLEQIHSSAPSGYLEKRKNGAIEKLSTLIKEKCPPEGDESAERERFLYKTIQKVEKILSDEERSRDLSRAICQMLGNDPETMEAIPQNSRRDIQAYSERIYEKMRKQVLAGTRFLDFDSDKDRERFVRYFLLRIEPDKISNWLQKRLENITHRDDVFESRTLEVLSLWIERQLLLAKPEAPKSVPADEDQESVPAGENSKAVPAGWVDKLIAALKTLVKERATKRGCQEGDEELKAIAEDFKKETQETLS